MRHFISREIVCAVAAVLALSVSTPTNAGPYAAQAAQVQANDGILDLWADADVAAKSSAELDALAVDLCHQIAAEGVTVNTVRILDENGGLIREVGGETLAGC